MQSSIRASQELHQSFNELVSSPQQRGLLVGIKDEQLVPLQTIPSTTADFSADLSALASSLKDDEAAYVILRRYAGSTDGYVAVTYVPDTAKVRQKMLYASTRLSLVRELGTERFRETLFATTKAELTAKGFLEHDRHGELKAPLTQEEQSLEDLKEAEAAASQGTTSRSSHVTGITARLSEEALQALRALKEGAHNLVQLSIDIPSEEVRLAGVSTTEVGAVSTTISAEHPRYSFFRYQHDFEGRPEAPVLFFYTCPSESKIKERMLYATAKGVLVQTAETEAGVTVAKKLEATSPSDFTAAAIQEELHPRREEKATFSRPKRPGKK